MHYAIHHIDKVASTNDLAFEVCAEKEPEEGTVYVAYEQTAGKGYHDNIWVSEKGKNLTMSLVLCPGFINPSEQFVITQLISLATADTLKTLIPEHLIRIKWPNDLYINEAKVGGILVQNSIMGDRIEYTVVGIGLNVNQREFPESLPNPVSVGGYTNKDYELDDVLKSLLHYINVRYTGFSKYPDRKQLQDEYLKNLYRYQELAAFKDKDGIYNGRITDVDAYGRLEITAQNGVKKHYNFKEVAFVLTN